MRALHEELVLRVCRYMKFSKSNGLIVCPNKYLNVDFHVETYFFGCGGIRFPISCLFEVNNRLCCHGWGMPSDLGFRISYWGSIINSTYWICAYFTFTKILVANKELVEEYIWYIWFWLWKNRFYLTVNSVRVQPRHNDYVQDSPYDFQIPIHCS